MSEKLACPGCQTYTSRRLAEFEEGRPCSGCGLSAQATGEILAARQRWQDSQLRDQLEATLIRAGKAEGERDSLRRRMEHVSFVLQDLLENKDDN